MAIKKGAPAAEAAVANTIRTYINAEVDDVKTAWNDSIPLPYPVQVYTGYRRIIPEYPAIVVSSVDGQETLDAASFWGQQEHRIDVSVICQSDDIHVLDQQTKRYLVAIWEVIKKHQDLDASLSGLAGVATRRYGRSEIYNIEKSHFLHQAAGWELAVHVDESV